MFCANDPLLNRDPRQIKSVILGKNPLTMEEFVAVARFNAEVIFSDDYRVRVAMSRQLVDQFLAENRLIYGVTTGFGDNVTQIIPPEEAQTLQKNILLSHACSVGDPLAKELVRATQLMVLLTTGQGFSGISLEVLELIRNLLNRQVTPRAPGEGSVGYLAVEAHLALVLIGCGQAWYDGELMSGEAALEKAGLLPVVLKCKEGLSLINGTISLTGIGLLAIYDGIIAAKVMDIAAALSFEALRGNLQAFDPRLQSVKHHVEQQGTARNMLRMLEKSSILAQSGREKVQDCVTLRAIPQIHGAVKRLLREAHQAVTEEMNSCSDNPVIFPEGSDGVALMGVNPDGSYVGSHCDCACIAMGMMSKLSERRIDRLTNSHFSNLPAFLVKNPGLNNGYMIPQYTAAGLAGDIKVLSHPSSVDSIPTSANQEDYVSMGYFAAYKAYQSARKLHYILAIELMAAVQGLDFLKPLQPSILSSGIYDLIRETVPSLNKDRYIYPDMEHVFHLVRDGDVLWRAQEVIGDLEF